MAICCESYCTPAVFSFSYIETFPDQLSQIYSYLFEFKRFYSSFVHQNIISDRNVIIIKWITS